MIELTAILIFVALGLKFGFRLVIGWAVLIAFMMFLLQEAVK